MSKVGGAGDTRPASLSIPILCEVKEINMKPYPLLLSPVTKTALWGGVALKEKYHIESLHDTVSESWQLTLRPDAVNTIRNGEAAGMSLAEYFAASGISSSRFPLLIKLIDARDKLSVQVHPNDADARVRGIDSGKTEMWYVVGAEKDATLIAGLAPGLDTEDFAAAIERRDFMQAVREVPVKPGDVFFIPAGLLHAIGAGILIAEIQQNSDTTYRVWDYERRDAKGCLRELHLKDALEVIRPIGEEEILAARYAALPKEERKTASEGDLLADCGLFRVERVKIPAGGTAEISPRGTVGTSLILLAGEGVLSSAGETVALTPGASILLPPGCPPARLTAECEITLIASSSDIPS